MPSASPCAPRRRGAMLLAAAASVALFCALPARSAEAPVGEARRLADVCTAGGGRGSYPGPFAAAGTRLVFGARSGEADSSAEDRELWVTDGTSGGTVRIADIFPGPRSSDPRGFVSDGSRVWFSADDGSGPRDVWVTDGTSGGTVRVTSLPGSTYGATEPIVLSGGRLWFTVYDADHGTELWASDDSPAGASLVADLNPGPASSEPRDLRPFGGKLFFTCDDGVHGTEVWSTDGTPTGTSIVADISPGAPSSTPQELVEWKGALWFRATSANHDYELWTTDGTPAGTVRVADAWPGPEGGFPIYLTPFGDLMLFAARGGMWTGYELWRTDGTEAGTWMVRELYPGSGGSAHEFVVSGDRVFFGQNEPGTGAFELFVTDGTYEGTTQVKDIRPGDGANPYSITPVDGGVLFAADDGTHGRELWRSDGTADGTFLVADLVPGADGGGVGSMTRLGGALVFGGGGGGGGWELWRTDGTTDGTQLVANLCPDAPGSRQSAPRRVGPRAVVRAQADTGDKILIASDGTSGGTVTLRGPGTLPSVEDVGQGVVLRGSLVFNGVSAEHGSEPWITDGTPEGTRLVADVEPGPGSLSPAAFGRAGSLAVFGRGDSVAGIWASDGTGPGTRKIRTDASIYPWGEPPVAFGRRAFFAGSDEAAGVEPWISDGTEYGTLLLRDVSGGSGGSYPSAAVVSGGFVWFLARDAEHGSELWRTDGTPEGTLLVHDVRPGTPDGATLGIGPLPGGAVVFAGWGDSLGRELWRSDGTPEGTVMVADLVPGAGSSDPSNFVRTGNLVFFRTEEDGGTDGIWVTDGTAAGTRRVPHAAGWQFAGLGATGVAVLAGEDGESGRELWRSDGTDAGTWRVADVVPGTASSSPADFGWAGGFLYFSAWDPEAGREPWAIPLEALGIRADGLDSDGDGASDRIEDTAGTSPWDETDSPLAPEGAWADPDTMPKRTARIGLDFRKPNRDTVALTGTVHVPADFVAAGAVVLVDVGAVTRRFVLDRKGRSTPRGTSSFSVALKKDRKGVLLDNPGAKFTMTLKKASCAADLADEGLTAEATVKKVPRTVAATVIFDGRAYAADLALSWTAAAGKSGVAR